MGAGESLDPYRRQKVWLHVVKDNALRQGEAYVNGSYVYMYTYSC